MDLRRQNEKSSLLMPDERLRMVASIDLIGGK